MDILFDSLMEPKNPQLITIPQREVEDLIKLSILTRLSSWRI